MLPKKLFIVILDQISFYKHFKKYKYVVHLLGSTFSYDVLQGGEGSIFT